MASLKQLSQLRRAEWETSSQLLSDLRELIDDVSTYDALYDGLRCKITYLLRSGAVLEQVSSWQEAILTIKSQAAIKIHEGLPEATVLDERLTVLRDVTSDLMAQLRLFAPSSLKDQPHYKACLKLLRASSRGEMLKADLIEGLGLKDANGSRILKNLETERLIRRRREGRRVIAILTPEGRKAIMEWDSPPKGPKLTIDPIEGVHQKSWPAIRVSEQKLERA